MNYHDTWYESYKDEMMDPFDFQGQILQWASKVITLYT